MTTSAIEASLMAVSGSRKKVMPIITVSAVPTPDQMA